MVVCRRSGSARRKRRRGKRTGAGARPLFAITTPCRQRTSLYILPRRTRPKCMTTLPEHESSHCTRQIGRKISCIISTLLTSYGNARVTQVRGDEQTEKTVLQSAGSKKESGVVLPGCRRRRKLSKHGTRTGAKQRNGDQGGKQTRRGASDTARKGLYNETGRGGGDFSSCRPSCRRRPCLRLRQRPWLRRQPPRTKTLRLSSCCPRRGHHRQ